MGTDVWTCRCETLQDPVVSSWDLVNEGRNNNQDLSLSVNHGRYGLLLWREFRERGRGDRLKGTEFLFLVQSEDVWLAVGWDADNPQKVGFSGRKWMNEWVSEWMAVEKTPLMCPNILKMLIQSRFLGKVNWCLRHVMLVFQRLVLLNVSEI